MNIITTLIFVLTMVFCVPANVEAKDFYRIELDELNRSAAAGNPSALYALGVLYYLGQEGVDKDVEVAIYLFKLSAERGNIKATNTLIRHLEYLIRQHRQVQRELANKINNSTRSPDREGLIEAYVEIWLIESQRDRLDDFLYLTTGWESKKRRTWKNEYKEGRSEIDSATSKEQFFEYTRVLNMRLMELESSVGKYTFYTFRTTPDYEEAYYQSYFDKRKTLGITDKDRSDNSKRGWLEFINRSKNDMLNVKSKTGYYEAVQKIKKRGDVTKRLYGSTGTANIDEKIWRAYARVVSGKKYEFNIDDDDGYLSEEKIEERIRRSSYKVREMEIEHRVLKKLISIGFK